MADVRKDNGPAIRKVCARFVALCRQLGLLADAGVAIDGSKFKAVNARDRNFTRAKMKRRMAQIEKSVGRYPAIYWQLRPKSLHQRRLSPISENPSR